MNYAFHPEALDEFEAAAKYYAHCQSGLELRFIACVETALRQIAGEPTRWRIFEEDIRRCLVDGSLIIHDSGCGSWERLIVTGPLAGEIWDDRRIDGQGIFPVLARDGTHQKFLQRVLNLVDLELYCLGWPGKRRQAPTYPGPSRRKLPLVDG